MPWRFFLCCSVCFVLFRFRLYAFVEAAALRSIVLRYAGVPIATRVSFFLFFPFLFIWICRFFRVFFVSCPLSLCMESTSYVLSFRMVFSFLVTMDWIFYNSLCENSINQSINQLLCARAKRIRGTEILGGNRRSFVAGVSPLSLLSNGHNERSLRSLLETLSYCRWGIWTHGPALLTERTEMRARSYHTQKCNIDGLPSRSKVHSNPKPLYLFCSCSALDRVVAGRQRHEGDAGVMHCPETFTRKTEPLPVVASQGIRSTRLASHDIAARLHARGA